MTSLVILQCTKNVMNLLKPSTYAKCPLKKEWITCCVNHFSTQQNSVHMCIVGSGPAGFYTAQQLLKGNKNVHVDIYERLPVPFGLVRYGVAPDHPEVKNVIHTFNQTASNSRCSFLGNVNVGKDIRIDELRKAYTAIIMCYGADDDKKLGIPGETCGNVLSAREFVGWYNGLPEHRNVQVNLDTETAIILGQGNVALDMARILLTPISDLAKTDITEYSLDVLEKSRIKKVYIVGRRGPLQVAFTIKELREMTKLPDVKSIIEPKDFHGLFTCIDDLPRPRRRLTKLMQDTANHTQPAEAGKEWNLRFLRSPKEIICENGHATSVKFFENKLEGDSGHERAVQTDVTEIIPCGLVLRSIGYRGVSIDDTLPFDESTCTFLNTNGHVNSTKDVYCSGWISRGPEGVILTTMTDAFEVGKRVLADLDSGKLELRKTSGQHDVLPILKQRGVQVVSFDGWNKIFEHEVNEGQLIGKLQDKVTDVNQMLDIAAS